VPQLARSLGEKPNIQRERLKRMARPSKLTGEARLTIWDAILVGATFEEACRRAPRRTIDRMGMARSRRRPRPSTGGNVTLSRVRGGGRPKR
jgi:hypothetical protein